jgi:hypothetical protein
MRLVRAPDPPCLTVVQVAEEKAREFWRRLG